jgi:phosphonate transport system substrate-binding protein
VARADSGINAVSDLHGRSFAFGSEKSTSSHLMPRAMLLEAGIKLHDLKSYKYHDMHDAVARAVLSGDFDAGGLMETVAKEYMSEGLKIIKFSEEIANFNISATRRVDEKTREKIRQALLALDKSDPRHAAILRAVDPECERFVEVSDSEYDVIRRMARKLYGIDYR